MKFIGSQRFLTIYSGILTATFAVAIFTGFARADKKLTFEEINVQRMNIIEPDGTIRMVVSDKSRFPGLIIKGKEYPHDRKTAGMVFFDDEGTENGGLIFGGMKDSGGKVQTWGHLSFDQYNQDQVFTIDASEENGSRRSGVGIWDRGDYPITDAIELVSRIQKLPQTEREAEMKKFFASHPGDAPRAYLGRMGDRSVGLRLMDANGHDRLRLRVEPDGSPTIEFLDATGKVTAQFPSAPTTH
jgi:hypothetical protein